MAIAYLTAGNSFSSITLQGWWGKIVFRQEGQIFFFPFRSKVWGVFFRYQGTTTVFPWWWAHTKFWRWFFARPVFRVVVEDISKNFYNNHPNSFSYQPDDYQMNTNH